MSNDRQPPRIPMKTTSRPDKHDPKQPSDLNMRPGVKFGKMAVTNGPMPRPARKSPRIL